MGSDEDERRAILNAIEEWEECAKEASRHDKSGNITKIMTACAAFVSDSDDTGRPDAVAVQEHSESATDPL